MRATGEQLSPLYCYIFENSTISTGASKREGNGRHQCLRPQRAVRDPIIEVRQAIWSKSSQQDSYLNNETDLKEGSSGLRKEEGMGGISDGAFTVCQGKSYRLNPPHVLST